MKRQIFLRQKAISLRRQGKSYGEISKQLIVAKSTLSYWLKGIKLRPEDLRRLYSKQIVILSRGAKSLKERRAKEVEKLIKDSSAAIKIPLDDEVLRFVGVALYWAEGSKCKIMQITNSDPYLILFFIRWINKFFKIDPINLKANLNIYSQQNEGKIKAFWSELTGIPVNNFGKSYIKPKNKGYKKNNLYFGTLRLYVPRSTDIKYKMLGWLQALLRKEKPDVELLQRRWSILQNAKRPINLPC